MVIYHLYRVPRNKRYFEFEIPKKSGELRKISAPNKSLKIIQQKFNRILQCIYEPKSPVHGFVIGGTIKKNAKPHAGRRFVFNIDLENFYPSIHIGRVRGLFKAKISSKLTNPPTAYEALAIHRVSTILAQLCCHESVLPQGAPTSPIISNMICSRLDSELMHLASQSGCMYTRYADDITFSTSLKKFPETIAVSKISAAESKIVVGESLKQIIKHNDFKINQNKVRLRQRNHQRQVVTGLTVNQFPNFSESRELKRP